MMVRKGIWC